MNKKLLALAIAGAFVAPVAAMADSGNVTIYGQMNASVDSVDSGAVGNSQRTTQINDNSSRLGFKGTEALGNGLSAVWQIESSITADGAKASDTTVNGKPQDTTGSNKTVGGLNARNTFVGLTGGFGTAILGRHDTPYKLATRNLDVFGDGIADNRSIMGQSGNGVTTFDGRQSNVVAYISPNLNGFTGAIGYVAGAENAFASGVTKGSAWSAMGNYANGPIYGALAYEKHNVGNFGTGTLGVADALAGHSEKSWKLGGGYATDVFKVGLVYEKTSEDFITAFDTAHHSWYLSGAYMFGNNAVKAAYTKAGDRANASDSGAKQYSIGFDHMMSKRTTVYALYTKLKNDTAGTYALGTSVIDGGVDGGTGSDPSAVSLGIKHSF